MRTKAVGDGRSLKTMHMPAEDMIPQQDEGVQTNTESSVDCPSEAEARHSLEVAKKRLLNVNGWQALAGAAKAAFHLTDKNWQPAARPARPGDYFRIDLPGPGTQSGEGYDWVRIEDIREEADATAIKVRPACSPLGPQQDIAHFFSEAATSAFLVKREQNKITAGEYGGHQNTQTGRKNTVEK